MSPRNPVFSKAEIIEASFELVRKQGWQGFSVQAVAKAIGSSTMPIYSQFANVRELEDEVVWKTLLLLKERMLEVRTGDKWIDHAINWVRFAEEETHLHRILWDGRNLQHDLKCGEEINRFISAELSGYPLFEGLGELERKMIVLSRRAFIQRIAAWLNADPEYLSRHGIDTEEFIRRTSKALYDGFRMQSQAEREVAREIRDAEPNIAGNHGSPGQ